MYISILAALAAFFVKGLAGFANTLIFSTVMSFAADNLNITPLELMLGYPCNLFIAWKERKSIRVKVLLPLTAMVIAGSIPGAFLLKTADARLIKGFFGAVVIVVGLEMLLREFRHKTGRGSPLFLTIIGLLSGVLCGLFGVGALLAAYISRTSENQKEFKGTISAVFVAENTFRLILYTITGILTPAVFGQALKLAPFMLLGLAAGMLLSGKLPERTVKIAVILLLILSGLALIFR